MLFSCLKTIMASSRQTVAGASQLKAMTGAGLACGVGKSRRLILAEGRRGSQEFNWVSSQFISFIRCPFQTEFDLLQTVAVSSSDGVRRNFQHFANFIERVAMPDFQHNYLALFHRQFGEAAHRGALR